MDAKDSSGKFDPDSALEIEFLARHGVTSIDAGINKSLRYYESVLHLGETITIVGTGVRELDPSVEPTDDYRSGPVRRLRLTGSAEAPLLISDKSSAPQSDSATS